MTGGFDYQSLLAEGNGTFRRGTRPIANVPMSDREVDRVWQAGVILQPAKRFGITVTGNFDRTTGPDTIFGEPALHGPQSPRLCHLRPGRKPARWRRHAALPAGACRRTLTRRRGTASPSGVWLEPHAVGLDEDLLRKRNDLEVGRMIDRLDPNNLRCEPVLVLLQMLEQLELV